ncbi:MAG TPA: zinc-ribbon domain-containing protein [Nitrospirales bacterium]
MDIICQSCSTKLTIPNEKVPKDAVFKVTCPKCQTKNQVNTKGEAGAMLSAGVAPRPGQKEAEPASSLEEIPEEMIPIPTTEEDFVEDQRLAMICFEQPQILVVVRAALEGLGYTVHVPAKADDAVQRLRQNRYEVLLLHEDYGGSPENNLVLLTIQPMVMTQRRHMCVGLVGKQFRTFDHMLAFAKSVNFVVAERELNKIKAITYQAVSENDQFYRVFREALRDAGQQ